MIVSVTQPRHNVATGRRGPWGKKTGFVDVGVDHLHQSRQCSLREAAEFEGVGLHTGEDARVVVIPAPANAGIVFRRKDLERDDGQPFRTVISAAPENVVRSDHGTTIANGFGVCVSTVEHVMAALAIARIDNAVIDVYGPEVPILDGSAAPFLAGLQAAGIRSQNARRVEYVVREAFSIKDGDREILFEPAEHFSLHVEIDFEDCLIGRQRRSISLSDASEIAKLASARTFCRLHEVDALRRAGLIQGGSLENSLVVDGERLLNGAGLRDPNEFVLHKALDLIGDLYLIGMPLRGAVKAVRPGHDVNCRAALTLTRQFCPSASAAAASV